MTRHRVGILGGGQLGRMLALAAAPLDIACTILDPDPNAPARVAADHIVARFDDESALQRLADGSDVITFEFENVPVDSVAWFGKRPLSVWPGTLALEVAQDRLNEKSFFRDLSIPTPAFHAVETRSELDDAVRLLEFPCVLKTRRFGYDGKGQAVLRNPADVDRAWNDLGGQPLIAEEFIAFERELSILAVRNFNKQSMVYPPVQNVHRNGILHVSLAPAPGVSARLYQRAADFVHLIMDQLGYVGVLAVEFFMARGELYANEMAPRVHNSGHWTIEGATTSQFENHMRAVLNLPLGDVHARGCSLMVNLVGEVPPVETILRIPNAHVHLYGKEARPGRKLGHVTLCGPAEAGVEPLLKRWQSAGLPSLHLT